MSTRRWTEQYVLTLGITPGYGHHNEAASSIDSSLNFLIEKAIKFCEEIEKETKVLITLVATVGRAAYPYAQGCPRGGETVFILTGERNPEFCKNSRDYSRAWRLLAQRLKAEYKQKTVRLVSRDVELEYITD